MSPEVNAATKVGACRMKIISDGTPYLEKKPCSLAAQSGRTLALTAACAMMVLAGADAASRAFSEIDNPRTTKKNATHLLIVHPFPGYSSGATADTRTSRHNEFKVPVREAQSRSRRELFSYSLVKSSCWLKSALSPAPAGRTASMARLSGAPSDGRRALPPPIRADRPRKVRNRRRRSG